MLQSIRDRAQGWLAGVIIALICIPFALWGVNEYITVSGKVTVAEVNGTELTLDDYRETYQEARRRLEALLGQNIDVGKLDEEVFKGEALKALVQGELLRQTAQSTGMRIGDVQVQAAIAAFEPFQREGKFSRDLYERQLRANGMNPVAFEERMRRDMLREQLRQGVADTAFVTEAQARALERIDRQKRDLRYVVIEADPFRKSIDVTDADIQARYDANPGGYVAPERVKVAYLELSLDALAAQVGVDEASLRAYFDTHKATYSVAEERSATYVLAPLKRDAGADAAGKAREIIAGYRDRVASGTSFEDVVKEITDAGTGGVEGGETGFVQRGVMPKEFDEALFALEPGGVSEVFQTDYGFHLIKLLEVRAGGSRTFEEARADVERDYRRTQAEAAYYEQAERLSSLVFEQPDTLAGAADELGLTIRETDWFGRDGGDGIAGEKAVIDATFADDVLTGGANSEAIELGDNRLVVVRVAEHRPEHRRDLAEVRDQIRGEILEDRAREQTRARGEELLRRLRAGETTEALAAAEGVKWEEAQGVVRTSPDVHRAVLRQAFKMPRPDGGAPVLAGVSLGTGDYAVVQLLAVADPDAGGIEDKSIRARREQLVETVGMGDWRAFISALEHGADVKTDPDAI